MSKIAIQRKLVFAGIIAILVFLPFILPSLYWVSVSINIGITVLLVTSLRLISLVGHYSLGHIAFMLIGAYTSALLVMKAGISFWVAFILAGFSSAIIALAVAYPFLKVKGVYFAILTLLTAETFRLFAWNWKSLTGGEYGLVNFLLLHQSLYFTGLRNPGPGSYGKLSEKPTPWLDVSVSIR
jgi:branched-chain amino acid transport system permease protein